MSTNTGLKSSLFLTFVLAVTGCVGVKANKSMTEAPCVQVETQRELTVCWTQAAGAAEARLEERLAEVRARFDTLKHVKLDSAFQESQLNWSRYRDAQCRISRLRWEGGSGEAMAVAICRHRLAGQRNEELIEMLEAWSM